jgi:ribosomal protein S18 acetylase RimI-like enzyme
MFVAARTDQIVGWCDISPQSCPSLAHRGDLGMGVHPSFRRQGLGRRLLQSALAAARTFGLERVELAVLTHNTAAVALYQSLGFEIEGTIRHAQKLDHGYGDDYIMALRLQ